MPGISGSSGGSSDCWSVCAIAARVAVQARVVDGGADAQPEVLGERDVRLAEGVVVERDRAGAAVAHEDRHRQDRRSGPTRPTAAACRVRAPPRGPAGATRFPRLAPTSRSSPSSSRWIAQPSASVAATSRATSGSVSSSSSERASARELSARKRCASSACLISVMSSMTLIASRAPPSSSTGLAFTRDQRDSPGWRTTSGSAGAPLNTRRPGSRSAGMPSREPSSSAPPSSCAAAALT